MIDYLAVYDIADPRRLRRVAKLMQSYGERVQKSVFECKLSRRDFLQMLRQAKTMLEPDADDVRFYPLFDQAREKQTILGTAARETPQNAYFA